MVKVIINNIALSLGGQRRTRRDVPRKDRAGGDKARLGRNIAGARAEGFQEEEGPRAEDVSGRDEKGKTFGQRKASKCRASVGVNGQEGQGLGLGQSWQAQRLNRRRKALCGTEAQETERAGRYEQTTRKTVVSIKIRKPARSSAKLLGLCAATTTMHQDASTLRNKAETLFRWKKELGIPMAGSLALADESGLTAAFLGFEAKRAPSKIWAWRKSDWELCRTALKVPGCGAKFELSQAVAARWSRLGCEGLREYAQGKASVRGAKPKAERKLPGRLRPRAKGCVERFQDAANTIVRVVSSEAADMGPEWKADRKASGRPGTWAASVCCDKTNQTKRQCGRLQGQDRRCQADANSRKGTISSVAESLAIKVKRVGICNVNSLEDVQQRLEGMVRQGLLFGADQLDVHINHRCHKDHITGRKLWAPERHINASESRWKGGLTRHDGRKANIEAKTDRRWIAQRQKGCVRVRRNEEPEWSEAGNALHAASIRWHGISPGENLRVAKRSRKQHSKHHSMDHSTSAGGVMRALAARGICFSSSSWNKKIADVQDDAVKSHERMCTQQAASSRCCKRAGTERENTPASKREEDPSSFQFATSTSDGNHDKPPVPNKANVKLQATRT
ncbi:hypothetical protein C8R43DRAFT_946608 [Mycena crocata]|nr:hypothetical protein C8R43DRAFT_946608 [Mycena crocata]